MLVGSFLVRTLQKNAAVFPDHMFVVFEALQCQGLGVQDIAVRMALQDRPHGHRKRLWVRQPDRKQAIDAGTKYAFEIQLKLHVFVLARLRGAASGHAAH